MWLGNVVTMVDLNFRPSRWTRVVAGLGILVSISSWFLDVALGIVVPSRVVIVLQIGVCVVLLGYLLWSQRVASTRDPVRVKIPSDRDVEVSPDHVENH